MWSARFTESQLETLKDLIRIQGEVGSELEGALEALELARWDDLPEAELPWPTVTAEAERQGITEADVIWDIAGRKKEPAFPVVKRARRQATRPKRARKAAGYPRSTVSKPAPAFRPRWPSPTSSLMRPGGRCAGSAVSAYSASPIASATSMPTRSSSSSGPIG